ncbi:MAG: T9SS type A sorting domain-containing protein [Saprospiraceae bacterium]
MTPIRYTCLLLFFCFLAGLQTAHSQCSANVTATNITCFGQNDGSIDLTASNGTAPYTYAWSNNATSEDISNLSAGIYTCTVTDNVGCTTTAQALVSQPTALVVTVSDVILNCITPSATLTAIVSGGIGPYFYNWSTGSTNSNIQVQQPGNYTLTVTDQNGCTATKAPNVFLDAVAPLASAGPDLLLTCAVLQMNLDGSASSTGPNFTHQWTTVNGSIVNGANTPIPVINAPGIYTLIVTNHINGCTSTDVVVVTEDVFGPLISVGPDLELPCNGGVLTLPVFGPGGPNFTFVWTTLDGSILSGASTLNPVVDEPGTYMLVATNTINGCTSTALIVVNDGGAILCSKIKGRVLQDTTKNCLTDVGEPPISGWIVKAQGAMGTFYALTDANGDYQIFVKSGGDYAVSAIAPSALWWTCSAIPNVSATDPDEIYLAEDLLFQKLPGCPLLTVDISSGNLRRCFTNNHFSVSYCNIGTTDAEDAYVDVTLDAFLTPENSSIPFTNLGGGVLRFEVGDLAEGACGSFWFKAYLSCDAALGQTHCTEAHIYPDSSCIPTDPLWSGASLRISSECLSDSLRFTIKNVGAGDMTSAVDYIVIEDLVMLMSAPLQLNAGDSIQVSVPANGHTWRLEVDQVPYHPGQSSPALSVEACVPNGSFSTGFVTAFPADDADEFIDIDCRANTASSDPNDKQGFPIGYGAAHYIRPGTPLEYLVRFQNTGNDTAFTVRLVDTLSAWLDPTSIRPGASSHPYSWDLSGAGVLSFLFENILLPDSNVNEAASHGFVKFTINHRADAPLESVIENTAEIYFDFNEAIVTNTTFHRLGENFVTVGLWQPQQPEYSVLVSPNPFSEGTVLEVKGLSENTPIQLQVFDLQGKLKTEMESEGVRFQLKKGNLSSGIYLFRITQRGSMVGVGKLIIRDR